MAKSVTTGAVEGGGMDAALDAILEALAGLRYGQLEVHLHDARLVKIMRTEKIRLYDDGASKAHDDGAR